MPVQRIPTLPIRARTLMRAEDGDSRGLEQVAGRDEEQTFSLTPGDLGQSIARWIGREGLGERGSRSPNQPAGSLGRNSFLGLGRLRTGLAETTFAQPEPSLAGRRSARLALGLHPNGSRRQL